MNCEKKIDEIDYQIHDLLNLRASYALKIAKVKVAEEGELTKFYRPEREAEILERITAHNKGPLSAKAIAIIFKTIMKKCRDLQIDSYPELKKMKSIGIQGTKGSFSEIAAQEFAKTQHIDDFAVKYLISSENVLRAIENKEIDFGIFAMENAQGGVVIESVKALAKYRCTIIDMFHIPISQNLIALPEISFGEITELHSHRQALRQCREFLATNFWGCPLIEENDTAESARRLKAGELPKTAAVIANKACAEIYNLQLLKENIHDLKNNLTLFLGVKIYEPSD
ncbi:chorismate mutase [Coxiella burnetii]|uniref:chorismate mutase n=1 Tax=Coxiella burnetii TaxID=777 RepID=UPI0013EA9CDF|nr:chorismate mutase [Coxiella burnetii]